MAEGSHEEKLGSAQGKADYAVCRPGWSQRETETVGEAVHRAVSDLAPAVTCR